jgi:DNA-binding FadR family transcriptional regulator
MQKVHIKKAADVIAAQIRTAIVRGELKDGDALPPEVKLLTTFAVSRPTIREAIRILESENLISVSRGARGGAIVRGPVSELSARALGFTLQSRNATLRDVYEARAVFEPSAARLAAQQRPRDKAVRILREQIEQERNLLGDRPMLASAMAEFHRLVVEQSGNKTLLLIAEALHHIVEKHHSIVYSDTQSEDAEFLKKRAQVGLRSQARLVDFIEKGDAAAAEDHWRNHMEKTAEFWLSGRAGSASLNILDDGRSHAI